MEKRQSDVEKTKVNRTVNAAHLKMALQKDFRQARLRTSSSL